MSNSTAQSSTTYGNTKPEGSEDTSLKMTEIQGKQLSKLKETHKENVRDFRRKWKMRFNIPLLGRKSADQKKKKKKSVKSVELSIPD